VFETIGRRGNARIDAAPRIGVVEEVGGEGIGVKGRIVSLTFSDGSERVVDLAPLLYGPVFEELPADDKASAEIHVDPETGTITWPNGADIDPDVIHGDFEAANPASIPQLGHNALTWTCGPPHPTRP
jgi:hypothetical protein